VLALDRRATGENRRALLSAARPSGGLAPPQRRSPDGVSPALAVGGAATVAIDRRAGRSLLWAAASGDEPAPPLAVPVANVAACAIADELGYVEARRPTRMRRGPVIAWRPQAVCGAFNL
jgi:hypothetical protein